MFQSEQAGELSVFVSHLMLYKVTLGLFPLDLAFLIIARSLLLLPLKTRISLNNRFFH